MEKEDVLNHLRIAKAAHIKWLQKAKLLIHGLDIKKDCIPVDCTECNFGIWFYSEGQMLNALANNPSEAMASIESLHFKLHEVYLDIYDIYFDQSKRSFFTKLFGEKRKKVSDSQSKIATDYYITMEQISKELLEEINLLEKRLIAVSEDKIRGLI